MSDDNRKLGKHPALGMPYGRDGLVPQLVSTCASVIKISTKAERWGYDSKENRPGHPDYNKTNTVIMVELMARLKRQAASFESYLVGSLVGLKLSDAAQVEKLLRDLAEREGGVAVLSLMKEYGVSDVCELLHPDKMARIISTLGKDPNTPADGCEETVTSWGMIEVSAASGKDTDVQKKEVVITEVPTFEEVQEVTRQLRARGAQLPVLLMQRVRRVYPSVGSNLRLAYANNDKRGIALFMDLAKIELAPS